MEDKLQSFRQPLVTATGIMLGFILNFAASWVKSDSGIGDRLAYFIGISVLAGTICLIAVLHRALRMDYPRAEGDRYHGLTLRIFTTGICLAFAGVLADMFANFMQD